MKFVKGNLLDLAEDGHFNVIVQGCNCFNTMGGGIAREIRERYPSAAKIDAGTMRGDYTKLGNWTQATELDDMNNIKFIIINAYTQYNMSTGEDVFEYLSFALILQKLAHLYPNKQFGFPLIGCGLAGGDKDSIMEMLQCFADALKKTNGTVTIVEYAP